MMNTYELRIIRNATNPPKSIMQAFACTNANLLLTYISDIRHQTYDANVSMKKLVEDATCIQLLRPIVLQSTAYFNIILFTTGTFFWGAYKDDVVSSDHGRRFRGVYGEQPSLLGPTHLDGMLLKIPSCPGLIYWRFSPRRQRDSFKNFKCWQSETASWRSF